MRPVEMAFEKFCQDAVIAAALAVLPSGQRGMVLALAKNAFVDGAKYATERCESDGHDHATDAPEPNWNYMARAMQRAPFGAAGDEEDIEVALKIASDIPTRCDGCGASVDPKADACAQCG